MDKTLILELKQPEFDRRRISTYYGNMGEIIAQQVLRKQGFEVFLTRPVACDENDFIGILNFPDLDKELEELRRYYENFPSYRKKKRHGKTFWKAKKSI